MIKRITSLATLISLILVYTACDSDNSTENPLTEQEQAGIYAESSKGMVASAHPLATQAGKEILELGGNAVDAAVATAFVLSVVEPSMSGLGGRLQAIVRTAGGEIYGVDATTQAPLTYDQANAPQASYGYPVIGVPGMLAGLAKLNREHGTMPLKKLMIRAINLAEEGFYQLKDQASMQHSVQHQLMEFEGSKAYFILPNDTVTYGTDNLLVQKDLAKTLRLIAEKGPDVFYKGEIADKMVADVSANGGALTLESLANYEAMSSKILTGSYRAYDVHGLWIPSYGAITIEILQILENLPMNKLSEKEWASVIYQAIKIAYEDRYRQNDISVGKEITAKEYAKMQSEKIKVNIPMKTVEGASIAGYPSWNDNPGHTTHLSVADKNGMVISLTQSLGPLMGSRVATPGLGFLYAATLGGYLGPFEPGQRAASHISPMILTKDGKAFMGVGAAGGSRIISAIVQSVCRVIDQDMNLADALAAPRVHPSNEGIILEMHDSLAWSNDDLTYLTENGFLPEKVDQKFRFGRVHAVMYNGTNWVGAADPDGEGTADGPN